MWVVRTEQMRAIAATYVGETARASDLSLMVEAVLCVEAFDSRLRS
ncbi:MAG TPA: hypothetical protein VHL52_01625 [Acidimicrobiia bacterium]|nr:hypothetical protein [Acidimicrobiia bacterium]